MHRTSWAAWCKLVCHHFSLFPSLHWALGLRWKPPKSPACYPWKYPWNLFLSWLVTTWKQMAYQFSLKATSQVRYLKPGLEVGKPASRWREDLAFRNIHAARIPPSSTGLWCIPAFLQPCAQLHFPTEQIIYGSKMELYDKHPLALGTHHIPAICEPVFP